ncbi:MAG: ribosomal protein S18-alanine N-acetyltransferase [Clostridiales bacterium]|nr:ribosomal protein S18-alanine N-acetyltransferase [Clostridiales bacterium]
MIDIVPMTEKYIDDVTEIDESCFHVPWTRSDFEKEVKENKMAIYYVAVDENGKAVGYAGMWHVVNEGHITNVAVLEEHRREGIGDMLMEALEEKALELEMIGITLEVRISNLGAQKLYTKHGYKPEGFRKRYYTDTNEDAVIMWKYFPNYENYSETL